MKNAYGDIAVNFHLPAEREAVISDAIGLSTASVRLIQIVREGVRGSYYGGRDESIRAADYVSVGVPAPSRRDCVAVLRLYSRSLAESDSRRLRKICLILRLCARRFYTGMLKLLVCVELP